MARSRNIKPGFFKNEELADIDPFGRLLYIGLWILADREGRLEDRPKRIKAELFPYDDLDLDALLDQLFRHNFIIRYQVDIMNYIEIPKFLLHQNPHSKEKLSCIPPATIEISARPIQEPCKSDTNNEQAVLIPDSFNLIPDSFNLIPDMTESETPPDSTPTEREALKELKAVKDYKFDYQTELDFIRKLAVDYPKTDILFQIKKWCAAKIDNPLDKKSKPHSQLINWFNNAEKWRKEETKPKPQETGMSRLKRIARGEKVD